MRRLILITAALLMPLSALAQSGDGMPAVPVLRASVAVSSDVVRIGDVIDNAGDAANIAIYRAPDLGTTGTLPTTQVLAALRAHEVFGVDTRDLHEISVTRLARTIEAQDIERQVAQALAHRNGLGDARDIELTFDRGLRTLQLDSANTGALRAASVRFEPRSSRFDVVFEIRNDAGALPTRLRFTGTALATVEAAVLTHGVDRNGIIRASDIVVERRPRSEVGREAADRDQVIGMQARRALRAGHALRPSDIAKPDLVQRDEAVTIIYRTAGITLTIRGKALDNGTEGDVVNVTNLQSKRTFSGVVIGRGRVSVSPQPPATIAAASTPVALAANDHSPASRTAE